MNLRIKRKINVAGIIRLSEEVLNETCINENFFYFILDSLHEHEKENFEVPSGGYFSSAHLIPKELKVSKDNHISIVSELNEEKDKDWFEITRVLFHFEKGWELYS